MLTIIIRLNDIITFIFGIQFNRFPHFSLERVNLWNGFLNRAWKQFRLNAMTWPVNCRAVNTNDCVWLPFDASLLLKKKILSIFTHDLTENVAPKNTCQFKVQWWRVTKGQMKRPALPTLPTLQTNGMWHTNSDIRFSVRHYVIWQRGFDVFLLLANKGNKRQLFGTRLELQSQWTTVFYFLCGTANECAEHMRKQSMNLVFILQCGRWPFQ